MTDTNVTREQLINAVDDWLRCQFIMRRDPLQQLFSEISVNDYLTLEILARKMKLHESNVYLKDIAEEMEFPMSKISPITQRLQDKGLIYWEHDENGTFIRLSERGENAMKIQQERVIEIMTAAVENYGYDKFVELTKTRREFNNVLDKVLDA